MSKLKVKNQYSILSRLLRPCFHKPFPSMVNRLLLFVGSPLVALLVQLVAWQFPYFRIHYPFLWLVVAFFIFMLLWLFQYHRNWYSYIRNLEETHNSIRDLLLSQVNIDPAKCSSTVFPIAGIAEHQGTVDLVLDALTSDGLLIGALLDVVASPTGEIWGTVKVRDRSREQIRAAPLDRANAAFWETLEDRMKRDPTPPNGIHLEPSLPPVVRDILVTNERTKEDE